jgi:hypothetical protein
MMQLVIGEHRPHVGDAHPFELAIPLPGALAARPSIFERKLVRFHLGPPPMRDPRSVTLKRGPSASLVNQVW